MSAISLSEIRESYRKLGPAKFSALIGGLLLWMGVFTWLVVSLGWPDHYGFRCHGRGCLFEDLWLSPRLITGGHGSIKEYALFACYWSIVAVPLAALIWRVVKKAPRITIFEPASKE